MVQIGKNVSLSDDTVLGERVRIGNNVTVYPDVTIGDDCVIFDGAVIGRPPMSNGNTTRRIDVQHRPLCIGAGSVIGANAVLYTGITIGSQALVGDLASLREGVVLGNQVVVGRGVLVMYDATIGDRTRVIDGAILTGGMLIESDVFVGPGVKSINDDSVYLARFGLAPLGLRGPVVRRLALLGTGAVLGSGIEVGEGAIVAPHAMLTRDVPPWTMVAGMPARIKRPVSDEMRAMLLRHFAPAPDAKAA